MAGIAALFLTIAMNLGNWLPMVEDFLAKILAM